MSKNRRSFSDEFKAKIVRRHLAEGRWVPHDIRQLEHQLSGVWYDHRRSQQLRDEAPAAYKDVESVMRAQRDLVRIVRRLRPLLSYKGV